VVVVGVDDLLGEKEVSVAGRAAFISWCERLESEDGRMFERVW
jgi:hypothetical protein